MKRKLVAVLLGLMLIMPQISLASETEKSNQLTQVILKVKEQVSVPETCSEFEYREGENTYHLFWDSPEEDQRVEIQCEADGDILSYYYSETGKYSTIATVQYQKAKQAAEAFLQQVAKSYAGELRLKEEAEPTKGDEYNFTYEWVHNGVKVFQQEVEVGVHKQTGKVVYFRGISYDANVQFEEAKPKLSLEEAQKAYIKQIGLDLKYRTYRDDDEQDKSFLAYEVSNYQYKGISAHNGQVVESMSQDRVMYDKGIETTTADYSSNKDLESQLTVEEQKEVDQRKAFIEPQKIKQQASVFFPFLADMEIVDTYLMQSRNSYIRWIEFEGKKNDEGEATSATLRVNALTGEILSYNYSEEPRHITLVAISEENDIGWSNEKASAFVKKVDPEAFKSLELKDSGAGNCKESTQHYQYQRMVHDIPVADEGIRLDYHLAFEQVTSYYKRWSQAKFKEPKGILTQEQAIKNIGLQLVYMQVEEGKYALVYNHEKGTMLLDAFSGKQVDYTGQTIEKKETKIYTDIKGHPYEQIITNLYYSGIYLDTKKLNPDAPITAEEMCSLLEKATRRNSSPRIEETLIELGISKVAQSASLTKEQVVFYLVAASPYAKLAKESTIFNYPYKDEEMTESLKGYIAVAYGLGWIKESEYFNPQESLTKAEAMAYIYHALEDLSA